MPSSASHTGPPTFGQSMWSDVAGPGTRIGGWMHGGAAAPQLARLSAMNARLGQSYLGRSLQVGAGEALGKFYGGRAFGTSGIWDEGFLGMRGTMSNIRAGMTTPIAKPGMVYRTGRAMGESIPTASWNAMKHSAVGMGAKNTAKFAGATAWKSMGLLGTVAAGYYGGFFAKGYKEGGVLGAAGGVAESILFQAGIRAAGGALFNPFTLTVAAGAAAGYGVYQFGEAAKRHVQSLNRLEFGGGQIMDALGSAGAATMRQRSVMALQDTHLNGRMAMGNEALLMHTSFR